MIEAVLFMDAYFCHLKIEEQYMQRCLQLAVKGAGQVAPNPMVGAVLVYDDHIIGEGYHKKYGEAHAEVNCINSVAATDKKMITAAELAKDAALFSGGAKRSIDLVEPLRIAGTPREGAKYLLV